MLANHANIGAVNNRSSYFDDSLTNSAKKKIPVKKRLLKSAIQEGELKVKIQTEGAGGIAVYGSEFGRYALDPSLVLYK